MFHKISYFTGRARRPYTLGERIDSKNMMTTDTIGFATSAAIRDMRRTAFRQVFLNF